jgi:glyoxylase-like metal-dependent hydrolase (beta-lactamase superfamily II)
MIFRQLFDPTSSTYSYLLASRKGGEALIIDPVLEQLDCYLELLADPRVDVERARGLAVVPTATHHLIRT